MPTVQSISSTGKQSALLKDNRHGIDVNWR